MKRQKDEETEAKKGTNLCFWIIYLILSFVDFRQCTTYHSRYTWIGCVWKVGIREREMLKEIRCYGLTICHPTNIFFFWNSNSQCNGMKWWSLLKLFQKGWKGHFQSHFMRPRLSWYQNQTRTAQVKKILANIPNEHRGKNPQQNMKTKFNNTSWREYWTIHSSILAWEI